MRVIIDGYNLMHAVGLLHGPGGRVRLDAARSRLLELVARGHAHAPAAVTVVFDARHPPPRAPDEQVVHGVAVVFARGGTADDRIAELVRADPTPRGVTVVSDDHRVQLTASRRGCAVCGCDEYLDGLERPARPPAAPPPDKPDAVGPGEVERWLKEFGGE